MNRHTFLLAAGLLTSVATAQTLISSAGSSATLPGGSISWSVGEPVIGAGTVPGGIITQGFQQPNAVRVRINIAALLQGPYNSGSGLMNDGLRSNGHIPLSEPYSAMGFVQVGGGGETVDASVLATTGSDAIVDWVYVQLRDRLDNTLVLRTRCALVQRDGDIVDTDGSSPVLFSSAPNEYHVAVFHRNHLGVITQAPIALGSVPVSIDFSDGSTPTHGTEAQAIVSGTRMLWAGDVVSDGQVKYTGGNNDRDPILSAIGGSIPTNTITGYHGEDVNLDGTVKYTGADNDRDPILQIIGGTVPTATREEQVP